VDTLTPAAAPVAQAEPTRARYPDEQGYAQRAGRKLFYEVYGQGEPAILFLPSWSIVHSRMWKAQVPWFARRHRVVAFDGRGNGRSDRPAGGDRYRDPEFVADALAVLDAAGIDRAVVVGGSRGARWGLRLAAERPERVHGLMVDGPGIAMTPSLGAKSVMGTFEATGRGRLAARTWAALIRLAVTNPSVLRDHTARVGNRHTNLFESARMFNRSRWRQDYRGFLEWFFNLVFIEPHSTLAETIAGDFFLDRETALALCERVKCPSLVLSGEDDIITPPKWAAALAHALGARHLSFPGYGHGLAGRHPVAFNLALREFLDAELQPARGS
jgi:pimeloyl-ACP methyl ester carboxylesterase